MGMCKKCHEVYSALDMKDGYCVNCIPQEIIEAEKKKEEEQNKQEKDYTEALENILILNGTVNKKYVLHGMVAVVGEEFLNQIEAVSNANFRMRQLLTDLGFDGILNTRMESTVTHGRERDNQKIPFYSVILYGDTFKYV